MDSGPVVSLYDARMTVTGPNGERIIDAHDWFRGVRRTALEPGELLTAVTFPLPPGPHGGCFVKLGRYKGEDLAQVQAAVMALPGYTYRVAFGAVAPVPVRARKIEELMQGKPLTGPLTRAALDLIPLAISPISDVRAGKEYRLHMAQVMFKRAIHAAVQRMNSSGPAYGIPLI
jgi:carbon-monoxide dehydrogenase medium subunit